MAFYKAEKIVKQIEPYLNKHYKILDIGSGLCTVCEILRIKGYQTTPLDVQDLSFVDGIKPILYDGDKIPFNENEFDISLISTVLHHISHPKKILREAKRVSKKIIVVEDIYYNVLHRYLTYFFDSLSNWEFIGHPHKNKNDKGWKQTFKNLGLKLIEAKYERIFLIFELASYHLEK